MHFEAPASDPRPEGFEPWEIQAANAVVASFLAARWQFRIHAFEDLVQEGLLAWWEQRHRYAKSRGSRRTFLSQVVTSRLRDLRREELAEKRTADRKALSLDSPGPDDDLDLNGVLEDVQAEDPLLAAEASDRRRRLDSARERLSPRERLVLDGLLEDKTLTELSRALGISRMTLYAHRDRIRAQLEAEGLRGFL